MVVLPRIISRLLRVPIISMKSSKYFSTKKALHMRAFLLSKILLSNFYILSL